MSAPKVYVLYENPDWLPPLRRELEAAGLPYEEWFILNGAVDLSSEPPRGVFINRMSPSSHTRGHVASVDYTRELLIWLESHGRRVINGEKALQLEMSKVRQLQALRAHGIRTPHSIFVVGGAEELKKAARSMKIPFITKHNRGGKGLGVQLFRTLEAFDEYVESSSYQEPVDHVTLLQQYIESPRRCITRVEIVDGQFVYAINSDTSKGFMLCPADRCESGDEVCPATPSQFNRQNLFSLREDLSNDEIVAKYIQFMKANSIDLAGIEFVEDKDGVKYTFDVNGTTNYSPLVEELHGLNGMSYLAGLCKREIEKLIHSTA